MLECFIDTSMDEDLSANHCKALHLELKNTIKELSNTSSSEALFWLPLAFLNVPF